MKTIAVVVVRVYITEASKLLNPIVNYLKKEVNIRGLSVFRAISGFGESGSHGASVMDFALDLPLVIEFFDSKDIIMPALDHLSTIIKPEHILFWEAKANHS